MRGDIEAIDEAPEETRPGPGRTTVVALMVAIIFLAGVVGWRIGQIEPDGPDHLSVDVGFFQDMSTHHSQAVTMGFDYLAHGTDPLLRQIAAEIVTYQSSEMGIMGEYLTQWDELDTQSETAMEWMGMPVARGRMRGLATPQQMHDLATIRGGKLDQLFTRLVIDHHAAGVHMAEHAARLATGAPAKEWAQSMAEGQRHEIGELNRWRTANGLDPVDPGLD